MALYFHLVELNDGRWACRHGNHQYDQHDTLEQANDHIRLLAAAQSPASIFAHRRDGTVDHLEDLITPPPTTRHAERHRTDQTRPTPRPGRLP